MTNREKILAAVVLAMLVLWVGVELADRYRDALATRQAELAIAQERLLDAKLAVAQGERSIERLDAWQQRSLPANRDVAQSLYRTWLLDRCREAGLTVDDVRPSERTAPTATQSAVGYTITAQGTARATIALLYEFYRSEILQKITRLQVRPADDASQWNITLAAEALVLAGATHEDQLPDGVSDSLAGASLEDYLDGMGSRNVLANYRPPRREPPRVAGSDRPAPPPFDDAKFAMFTGAVGNGRSYQAWVHVRTTNEYLRLSAGDEIKVGLFEGRVVSVEPRVMTVQSGDKVFRVELGASLRDGKELKSGGETKEAVPADATDT